MFNTIEEYLDALKNEMQDADPALVQDAQADAREHLSLALANIKESSAEISEAELRSAPNILLPEGGEPAGRVQEELLHDFYRIPP